MFKYARTEGAADINTGVSSTCLDLGLNFPDVSHLATF
jgi:hypothetical protein